MFSRKTQNCVFRNLLQRVGLWRLTSPKTYNKLWAGSRETDLFSVFMWRPENQESWRCTFILKTDSLKTQKEPLSKSTFLPATNIQIPMSQIPIQRLSGRFFSFLKVLEGVSMIIFYVHFWVSTGQWSPPHCSRPDCLQLTCDQIPGHCICSNIDSSKYMRSTITHNKNMFKIVRDCRMTASSPTFRIVRCFWSWTF